MSIEAMKLALEALQYPWKSQPHTVVNAITALRAAITEASMQRLTDVQQAMEQEQVVNERTMTVVYRNITSDDARSLMEHSKAVWFGWCHAPYERDDVRRLLDMATTNRREWVGLTDEDIAMLDWESFATKRDCVQAIEAKLKEKNT